MKKNLFILLLFLASCNGKIDVLPDEKIHVSASFYPLAFFAQQVGGDYVDVESVIPTGIEPHDFEPTPEMLVQIHDSDLFVYNGVGFDPWAETMEQELINGGGYLFEASQFVDLQMRTAVEENESPVITWDPHFWLDPLRVKRIVDALNTALSELDPAHATQYAVQATAFSAQLDELHFIYEKTLEICTKKEFLVSHEAFAYLADRYGLTVFSIAGLSPHDEPSLKELEELVSFITEKEISVIYVEPLETMEFAETLSEETGAALHLLNPIEGLTEEEKAAGENYMTLMEDNLESLKLGLNCPSL